VVQTLFDPIDTAFGVFADLVLPEPDNLPASSPEASEILSIPPPGSFDLCFPKRRKSLRPFRKVPAVPKVSIDEDHHPLATEHHIGSSRDSHYVYSITQASPIRTATHYPLRRRIHPPDP
jgi:hypothetical protein